MNITKPKRLPLLCYDTVFKSVFQDQENILGKMISDITGIDYNLLKDNLILETNELPISRKNEKAKKCDFIIKIDENNMLNLELNRQSHVGLLVKNLSYVFNLFSRFTQKGEEYNENLVVMQINLNCFPEDKKPLTRYHIREDDSSQIYTNNLIIYALNIVKCHEVYYNEENNEIPNYIRWGAFIYCDDFSKIPEITKGIMTYEERNSIMKKVSEISKEDYFMTEEEALEWADWERRTIITDTRKKALQEGRQEGIEKGREIGKEIGIEEGREIGREEGREEGREQAKIETIKAMLQKEMALEDIRDITGKSIEEIEQIKNSQ